MKIRVPDYYKDFKCIAGACTDTCCAGWQVDVDDYSYAYYKKVQGKFGERLHSVMIDGKNGAEGQFRIRPDGRCPFLNDDNLCDLYAELGEDALCVTCDQYPRYTCEFGNLRETGIALSCKTAAELILKENRTPGFTVSENNETFSTLNNIDGELFINLEKARSCAYKIIWNRKNSIWSRICILLDFADEIQKCVKKPDRMKSVIEKYSVEITHEKIEIDNKTAVSAYNRIWKCYLKQVIIKKEWPEIFYMVRDNLYQGDYQESAREFSEYFADREYEYENILTYFVFRYFLKGAIDKEVLTKVKMAVVGTLIIRQCDIGWWLAHNKTLTFKDQVEIVHLYSREVEHSEENFDSLSKMFRKKGVFSVNNLKKLCHD